MRGGFILTGLLAFLLGWVGSVAVISYELGVPAFGNSPQDEVLLDAQGNAMSPPATLLEQFEALENAIVDPAKKKEKLSPHDWVPIENIRVYSNEVIIQIDSPQWARYTDTNSMDPLIDENTNTIQVVPRQESDVHVGDIISYESKYAQGVITHRVIAIGEDSQGWYAILKGDNNPRQDPGKVRFSQIKRIVVAIIY